MGVKILAKNIKKYEECIYYHKKLTNKLSSKLISDLIKLTLIY